MPDVFILCNTGHQPGVIYRLFSDISLLLLSSLVDYKSLV